MSSVQQKFLHLLVLDYMIRFLSEICAELGDAIVKLKVITANKVGVLREANIKAEVTSHLLLGTWLGCSWNTVGIGSESPLLVPHLPGEGC